MPLVFRFTAAILAKRGFALLLLGLLCSACSLNGTGTLAAKVTRADGAAIADIYSLGTQLRTVNADSGLTVGYQRRSYVFELKDAEALKPGWYFGHIPLPRNAFVAMDARSYGFELRTPAHEVSLSLGVRATTLLGLIERERDGALWISYTPDDPAATRLRTCRGTDLCLNFD